MDTAHRYLELVELGRDDFLEAAAPAALLRWRKRPLARPKRPARTARLGDLDGLDAADDDDTNVGTDDELTATPVPERLPTRDFELYPLAKKAGAAFADMITVGRTANNDVVLPDVTVSRFHAYFRRDDDGAWFICDASSKNGTRLGRTKLPARADHAVISGDTLRFGDVEAVFYPATDLFELLRATASATR